MVIDIAIWSGLRYPTYVNCTEFFFGLFFFTFGVNFSRLKNDFCFESAWLAWSRMSIARSLFWDCFFLYFAWIFQYKKKHILVFRAFGLRDPACQLHGGLFNLALPTKSSKCQSGHENITDSSAAAHLFRPKMHEKSTERHWTEHNML